LISTKKFKKKEKTQKKLNKTASQPTIQKLLFKIQGIDKEKLLQKFKKKVVSATKARENKM